ncbi:MAG: flagellar basal body P-ring formation chaperone FlgA [Magnetospiraceae bacterium]
MKRVLLIALLLLGSALPANAEIRVALRDNALVNDAYIRLNDLFSGLDGLGETAIAKAPAPGETIVLQARWLYRVARAYGIDWRPTTTENQVRIVREGFIIGREEIEYALLAALGDQMGDALYGLQFSTRTVELQVPTDIDPTVGVDHMDYNPTNRRFSAIVRVPANDPLGKTYRFVGRAHPMAEVPVLANRLSGGEVIGEGDLEWSKIRADRLRTDTVVDPADLVGMSVRRLTAAGQPLRQSQLTRPVVVAKKSKVTIVLKTALMTMTAQGEARENGALGDTISVTNLNSHKTVEAIVVGPDLVHVQTGNQIALNKGVHQ